MMSERRLIALMIAWGGLLVLIGLMALNELMYDIDLIELWMSMPS